jgi:DNA-directed RNA polymerase III subunit RPC1
VEGGHQHLAIIMALPEKPLEIPQEGAKKNYLVKQVVRERSHSHYQVEAVDFGALSQDEIARYGELEVLNHEKYDVSHNSMPYGVLDTRLGCSQRTSICGTCGLRLADCVGHFGHVRLALPVFHVGYLKHTYMVLQCICKNCGRLLLPQSERNFYLTRLRRPNLDHLKKAALVRKAMEECKRVRTCPYCESFNAPVKKGAGIPLIFKHQLGSAKESCDTFYESFADAGANSKKNLGAVVKKAQDDINPQRALTLFQLMTQEDREILDVVKPERLLITSLPVPPVCLRPSVRMGDSTNEDDLTTTISEIVAYNTILRKHLEEGSFAKQVQEAWKFLQDKCSLFINSEASGLDLPKGRPIRSLCTRLKGKEGRFRGNLSGKRVNFSGRTVISPDPNVSVEEVVVPEWIAKRVTYPERVCSANIERLREAIRRGPEDHPGATVIRNLEGKDRFLGVLKKPFRRTLAEQLRCGDIVMRHMRDGDIVLLNRQPSLHRLSIMAHKAKVMPGRTLRFNECVCAPYNADFDGDEMNIHMPQTEEARAEALALMGVQHGLVTPKNGEVAISATQDFLTASFLLTQKNVFLSRDKFCQLCCSLTDGVERIDLPPPAILKPCELWTGKQVFNVLLRPNRKSRILVNLEAPEKNYTKEGESMCRHDGWVLFRNSELLSGNLGKKILGGSKNGLFFP